MKTKISTQQHKDARTEQYCKDPVCAIEVKKKTITQLLDEMADTGFQGRKLGEISQLWHRMVQDPDLTIIMGYAASLSTTGQWKMINWLIENRFIDVLVPTGANISEDIVDAMGYPYWKGTHLANDAELLRTDLNRYYDLYGKESDYLKTIELLADFIVKELDQHRAYSSREFLSLLGSWLYDKKIYSIIAMAAHHGVPVFCPAIVDSPYGDAALVAKSKKFDLQLDQMKDFNEFMGLAAKVKDVGVVYIGGGVPKDYIQLLAVSSPLQYEDRQIKGRKGEVHRATNEGYYPHKYAIQITTDSPQWGSLSGCTLDEAVSWGKINEAHGTHLTAYCDATIAIPLVTHSLLERTGGKNRRGVDFSDAFSDMKKPRGAKKPVRAAMFEKEEIHAA